MSVALRRNLTGKVKWSCEMGYLGHKTWRAGAQHLSVHSSNRGLSCVSGLLSHTKGIGLDLETYFDRASILAAPYLWSLLGRCTPVSLAFLGIASPLRQTGSALSCLTRTRYASFSVPRDFTSLFPLDSNDCSAAKWEMQTP
jgi:hypothetical protein